MSLNITIKKMSRTSFEVVNHGINSSLKNHKTNVENKSISPLPCVAAEFVDGYVKANLEQFAAAIEKYAATALVRGIPYGIGYSERDLNKNGADRQECLNAIKTGQFFVNGEMGLSALKRIAEIGGIKLQETYNKRGDMVTGVTIQAQ